MKPFCFFNQLIAHRIDESGAVSRPLFYIIKNCVTQQNDGFDKLQNLIFTINLFFLQHYIDLNDPYLLMNTQRLQDGHSDYLAMLSPPDFEAMSSPHSYVNDVPESAPDQSGYLLMKPANIFSPRERDGSVFVFDNLKGDNRKDCEKGGEIVPMLNRRSESDSEALNSPRSYENPSYHALPKAANGHRDILKSKDNYVNMPQNKSAIISDNLKERHYVNGDVSAWNLEQTCL